MTEPDDDLQGINVPDELDPEANSGPTMTPKLLARLFVVPLLIVIMIVGCSLTVWLLFGWISGSRTESLEKLVARIEAGTGEKVLDAALLPKDREVWQAAMELAQRLQSGEAQKLSEEERAALAKRLAATLERRAKDRGGEMAQDMQRFLLTAVGRLGMSEGVPVAVTYSNDNQQPLDVRRDAVAALMVMKQVPEARHAWPEIAGLLDDREPVLRICATLAIGTLADPGDEQAIKALRRAYLSDDREVQWNAALALARLGDGSAVSLLKEMLTRTYWESVPVAIKAGDTPDASRRLTPVQVDGYLMVAMDAAQTLGGTELRERVAALTQDSSGQVRDHAGKALAAWPAATTRPVTTGRAS